MPMSQGEIQERVALAQAIFAQVAAANVAAGPASNALAKLVGFSFAAADAFKTHERELIQKWRAP